MFYSYNTHVAQNELAEEMEKYEIEKIFPSEKKYAQKELIDGSKHSMYDVIQVDSDVERRFAEHRLKIDDADGNVVCYFKSPNSFEVNLPKIIGNYVPDWGVIR